MISVPCNAFLSGTKYILIPNISGIIILLFHWSLGFYFIPEYQEIGIAIGYSLGIIVGIGYQIFMSFKKLQTFNKVILNLSNMLSLPFLIKSYMLSFYLLIH